MIHVEQHGPITAIRMARSWLGRPVYWTAAYWVDGLLVDTGPPCTARELAQLLSGMRVEQVVVTHAHEDHFGGLAILRQRFPEASFYAPRGALPTIAKPSRLHMPLYRRFIWGRPRPVHGLHSLDDVEDRVNTPSYSFRVIETPGHSPSHISLFEPSQRWLFCGDAFIGGKERAWSQDYDLFGVVSSLRTLASLRPERMFPGSGTVRRTALPDIHEKIGFYTKLAEQVAAHEAKGASIAELASELLGGETKAYFWTGGHYSAANLIRACRHYNAIVRPDGAQVSDGTASARTGATGNATEPPHARSTDRTI